MEIAFGAIVAGTASWILLVIAAYLHGRNKAADAKLAAVRHATEASLHVIGYGRVLERNGLLDAAQDEVKTVAEERGIGYSEREWKY